MDSSTAAADTGGFGPSDRPDDPMATARWKAEHTPLRRKPPARKPRRKAAPPIPDLEGCYYLG
jgi:hypothetical protein